jgi:hypothetical protein
MPHFDAKFTATKEAIFTNIILATASWANNPWICRKRKAELLPVLN